MCVSVHAFIKRSCNEQNSNSSFVIHKHKNVNKVCKLYDEFMITKKSIL